jgi:hypothetical protein
LLSRFRVLSARRERYGEETKKTARDIQEARAASTDERKTVSWRYFLSQTMTSSMSHGHANFGVLMSSAFLITMTFMILPLSVK